MEKKHLLVVDDDKRIRSLLKKFLKESSYRVTTAENSNEARELVNNFEFDLLIIDVMMPGEDGLSLTRHISNKSKLPILLLSARVEPNERILGLEMGADDYLAKPFEPRELLLRVEAILKRSIRQMKPQIPPEIIIGDKTYNVARRELWQKKIRIHLTSMETQFLQIFVENINVIITRDELQKKILSYNVLRPKNPSKPRNIDVQIKRLREKIEPNLRNPRYLKTVRGIGYIFEPS